MLRMEIALLFVLTFIAFIYFSAGRKRTALHTTFSVLLITTLVNLIFDGLTIYTVNHLESVPLHLNHFCHRIFIGSLIFVVFLFYQYISILVQEETGRRRLLDPAAKLYCVISEILVLVILPVHFSETPMGNYSDGIHVNVCYASVTFYLILCVGLLAANWRGIEKKKKIIIGTALLIEVSVSVIQSNHPTWLISGMGITLMTLAFYLTLENPEILRSELNEQKMSMLYLKSQVNPHFLYNTLDTIRIQAQMNGDKEVAGLLMKLVDFFRLSVKVNRSMVDLDDELDMIEAYMDLMCYRYPNISCEYEIDPDLEEIQVPNFILQPVVENSMLHGLKNKGYQGNVKISVKKTEDACLKIEIYDNGSGFAEGKKAAIDEMLRNYHKQAPKLTGNSIGVLNVQKRIKLLCGKEYGLWYTENEEGGITAHIRLPLGMGEE